MLAHLTGVIERAASEELSNIADAVFHQTTDLEIVQVVAAGRAPDGKSGRLQTEGFSGLLVIDVDGRVVGIKTKLHRNLHGNFSLKVEEIFGMSDRHETNLVQIDRTRLA